MTTIISKIRDLLNDSSIYTEDIWQYTGITTIYTLTQPNASSLVVYLNGSVWASSNYSFNPTTNKVTLTGPLTVGANLVFGYNTYAKYSDNELRGYIRSSLGYLAIEKYGTFKAGSDNVIFPTLSEAEEWVVAIIACILINPPLKAYKTPELTIDFTEKQTKEEKIHHTLLQFKKAFGITKYIKTDRDVKIDKEDE